MAYLLEVTSERTVFPTAETLLISPFKEIWDRDKDPKKMEALEDLAYVEFMTSFMKTNPYKQYPEDRKHDVLMETIITREGWEPDELIEEAMDKVRLFQTEASTTYSYYLSAKLAAENMRGFFETVDVTEKNFKTGNPIYKPKDITNALKDTADTLAMLDKLEKKVMEELYETVKNRSDKKISPFANEESFRN